MADQGEISASSVDSVIDSTAEKIAATEDLSKVLESSFEPETTEHPEVIVAQERELFNFFGRKKPHHKSVCGVKPVDVFLWRKKKISAAVLGGATALWVLFELLNYHLTSVVSHVLIFSIGSLFLWSNASIFIHKRPLHIPDVRLPEEAFVELASIFREETNRVLAELRDIASGQDVKKFLTVIAALWLLSIVGSFFTFLTLAYILLVAAFTLPVLYQKHKNEVDSLAEKAVSELKKQYDVLDAKVLSRIPRLPLDKKKD